MSQSTKLFVVLGFMFIIYTTMKGNLEKYLRILFGGSPTTNKVSLKSAAETFGKKTLSDVIKGL